MTTSYQPQTTSDTMARIVAGVDPWIAYRDFLEDWTYIPGSRTDLVVAKPAFGRREHRQWASLLAATMEALCLRDGVPVPSWTGDPAFRLKDPWYLYEGPDGSGNGSENRHPRRSRRGTSGVGTDSFVVPDDRTRRGRLTVSPVD
jgi:hypothetical protein